MGYSYEDIHKLCVDGYLDARRHERSKHAQLQFEVGIGHRVGELARSLYKRTWKPSPPFVFATSYPVPREIFAPVFDDRVVSHIVCALIMPVLERLFIYDSYSCRKGKGTQFGVQRFEHFIRSASRNWQKEVYVLSLDISGYFMSIDRQLLLDMVLGVIDRYVYLFRDPDFVRYLVREIIMRNPLDGCQLIGRKRDLCAVPPQKRMECAKPGCGLILGDVTSQMFSNLYLNPFDQFAKRELGIRYYGRYVDDARMVHDSAAYLQECMERSISFLKDNLKLTIHPHKCSICSSNDCNTFLGVDVNPWYSRISRNAERRLYTSLLHMDCDASVQSRQDALNSYVGYAANKHCRRTFNAALRRNKVRKELRFDNKKFIINNL